MKIKDWIRYLIYSVLICFSIVIRGYVGNVYTAYFKQELRVNYKYLIISVLIGICIGMILGLEHLLKEIKKEGTWKINFPKLIFLGIPSLYCTLGFILIYSGIEFLQNIITYPLFYLYRYISNSVPIFELIFGYVIVTSLYKVSEKKHDTMPK